MAATRHLFLRNLAQPTPPVALLLAGGLGGGARRGHATGNRWNDYDRKTETRTLCSILDGPPQFTVVVGGTNTGKSRLLKNVIQQHGDQDHGNRYAPVHMDLRAILLQTYHELGAHLVDNFPVWMAPVSPMRIVFRTTKHILRRLGGALFNLGRKNVDQEPPSELTPQDFATTLDVIRSVLPPWHLRPATQRKPVLFIDEAHRLGELNNTPDNAAALRMLLRWCVLNTSGGREDGRFHVIFASSSASFLDWLGEQGIAPHVVPVVVGDLDREHALAYYKQLLDKADVPSHVVAPTFDEVYEVCGGHLTAMREYIDEALMAATWPTNQRFSFRGFQYACSKLSMSVPRGPDSDQSWSREQAVAMLGLFAAIHRDGWILRADAEKTFGARAVKAIIDADVVHVRPNRPIVADLPGQPEAPVLTACTPVERVAMGFVVSNEQKLQNVTHDWRYQPKTRRRRRRSLRRLGRRSRVAGRLDQQGRLRL